MKNKLTDKMNSPDMQEKIRKLANQKNISMDDAKEMLRKKHIGK